MWPIRIYLARSGSSLGSSLIVLSSFLIFPFLGQNVNINRNQQRTSDIFDVVSFYSPIVLEYWALENIAKILTTGPRLVWELRAPLFVDSSQYFAFT